MHVANEFQNLSLLFDWCFISQPIIKNLIYGQYDKKVIQKY
jgi:hypothetical protein